MPESTAILELLRSSLEEGTFFLGEIALRRNCTLHHRDDVGRSDLQPFIDPHEAVEIAKYDDAGNYRPLKTAPNLRHGWILQLADLADVRLALDFLYPAALGLWHARKMGRLSSVPLRQTLERQTGMYAVVKKLNDEEIHGLIGQVCNTRSGCLRQILWPIVNGGPVAQKPHESIVNTTAHTLPLSCAEACNLFIAEGRKVVKARPASP